MGVLKSNLGIALVILFVAAMLGGACAPSEISPAPAPPAPPVPGGNQPPEISSLTAERTQIYPLENLEIRCVASDTDGDELDFAWACTGGRLDGARSLVIWEAPEDYGTYEVIVMVRDGKGGTAQQKLSLNVVANQDPHISTLVAVPDIVLPGGRSTITCVASDSDSEWVSYNWSASGGSISGVGDTAAWFAPNKNGTFDITVVVSDGRGGEAKEHVSVTAAAAIELVTIKAVSKESGMVSSEGDRVSSRAMAGDDDKDIGYRAFWSYDIQGLAGTEIKDASLRFVTRSISGGPFSTITGLKWLRLWEVRYDQGGLPAFDVTGAAFQGTGYVLYQPPSELDVTPEITRLVQAGDTRFQIGAMFVSKTNGNGAAEWIEWSDVTLEVTYSKR